MLAWGYQHVVKQNGPICDIHFKPFAKPGIQVQGMASVLKVVEGGMYARGTVANAYVDFKVSIHRTDFWAKVDVSAFLKPYEFEIGLTYRYIRCSLKKLFRLEEQQSTQLAIPQDKVVLKGFFKKVFRVVRKIVKPIVRVVVAIMKEFCEMGPYHYKHFKKESKNVTANVSIYAGK